MGETGEADYADIVVELYQHQKRQKLDFCFQAAMQFSENWSLLEKIIDDHPIKTAEIIDIRVIS